MTPTAEPELLNPQELRLTKKVTEETSKLLELEVTDAESYKAVAEIRRQIIERRKEIVQTFAPAKQKADQAHKEICKLEKLALGECDEAIDSADKMLTAFEDQEETKRKAKEAAEQAEQQRVMETSTLALAEAVNAANGEQAALQMIDDTLSMPMLPVTVQSTVPKVQGMYKRNAGYDIEILDESKIRPQFMMTIPDMEKIKLEVKRHGASASKLIGEGALKITPKQTRVQK